MLTLKQLATLDLILKIIRLTGRLQRQGLAAKARSMLISHQHMFFMIRRHK